MFERLTKKNDAPVEQAESDISDHFSSGILKENLVKELDSPK